MKMMGKSTPKVPIALIVIITFVATIFLNQFFTYLFSHSKLVDKVLAAANEWVIAKDGNDGSKLKIYYNDNIVGSALAVTTGGSVGIGDLSPIGPLSVGNSAIGGSDGYLVIGKNNGAGGSRHFRIGFDSSFKFTIGDYGANISTDTTLPVTLVFDSSTFGDGTYPMIVRAYDGSQT